MAIIRGIDHRPQHLQAIGLATVYHTLLQYELADGLMILLAVSRSHATLLASQLPFSKLVAVLSAAAHDSIQDETLRDECLALLKRASLAEEKRNQLVHSIWAVPLQLLFTDKVLRLKRKPAKSRTMSEQSEVLAAEDVQKIGAELRGVVDDFAYMWSRLSTSAQQGHAADGHPSGRQ